MIHMKCEDFFFQKNNNNQKKIEYRLLKVLLVALRANQYTSVSLSYNILLIQYNIIITNAVIQWTTKLAEN